MVNLAYTPALRPPTGGGNAMPPYLQARSPVTRSVLPTRSMVAPGENRLFNRPNVPGQPPGITPGPIQPPTGPAAPQQPAPAQTLYEFFKKDLENQRRTAMSDAEANASRRGVFYGTPLTTSQGDIQTEFLRGLGQLQAGVLQNEQQNELQRLGLASNLLNQQGEAQAAGISPDIMQTIGSLLAPRQGPQGAAPGITPGPTNLVRQGKKLVPPTRTQ